jgi:uncharacterized protein YjbI with pentapeptide repeats
MAAEPGSNAMNDASNEGAPAAAQCPSTGDSNPTPTSASLAGQGVPAPNPPPLAEKADDLEAIRDAVVDAASIGGGLWLSYLFVLFYLLVAVGGVTHRDLFLENPVKLPFLNIDLPLSGFFWLGPALFLIVHAYVLLHFRLLANKVAVLDAQLGLQILDPSVIGRLRRQLPSNIFVQLLAGPPEARTGIMGFLLKLIAWISLAIGPLALLVFFLLRFLPYHDEWITWWQRVTVVLDLGLLWALWPATVRREVTEGVFRGVRWSTSILVCLSVGSALMAFAIATFPGEWLDQELQNLPIPRLWSNQLVLPGLDVIDHSKLDTEAKISGVAVTVSLRGRHLEGAMLLRAVLRKVDFTAAHLEGATLDYADLRGARLACVQGRLAIGNGGECTHLKGASLGDAQLQGGSLVGADFRGANLGGAHFEGTLLDGAQLQGQWLDSAHFEGASLVGADLRGAFLGGARLQGASLDSAHLQGALLDRAQLHGASLDQAELQGASLQDVFVWRADSRTAQASGARIRIAETGPKQLCVHDPLSSTIGAMRICDWSTISLSDLEKILEEQVPPDVQTPFWARAGKEVPAAWRTALMARLDKVLNPSNPVEGENDMAQQWANLQAHPPMPSAYETEVVRQYEEIGCAADGAPYVLEQLLYMIRGQSFFAKDSPRRPQLAAELLKESCAGNRGLSQEDRKFLIALSAKPLR